MLNTTTSSGPTCASIRANSATISSSERASTPKACAWPPSSRMDVASASS
jgi:hypothetical protein